MSLLLTVFLVAGLIATLIFISGYIRGARIALKTYDDDRIEVDTRGDVDTFWWKIGAGVVAATLIIMMVGVVPAFVYVGPMMAIFTAAANGFAFFLEASPEKV